MTATNQKIARTVVALAAAVVMLGSTSAVADTAALWDKHCASCHGKDGKGKTKMGEKLHCRDLTDPAVKAKLNKDNVMASMTKGVKDPEGGDKLVMKAFNEKLSPEEMAALTEYTLNLK